MSRVDGFPEAICLAPCVAATTANITLSAPQTIDTVSVVADDRVIVKNQTDSSENGIYVCKAAAWTRATDMNETADMASGLLVVDVNQSATYELTYTGTYAVDSTEVTFTQPVGNSSIFFVLDTANDQTISGAGAVVFASGTAVTFNESSSGLDAAFSLAGGADLAQTSGGSGYIWAGDTFGVTMVVGEKGGSDHYWRKTGTGDFTIKDTDGVTFQTENDTDDIVISFNSDGSAGINMSDGVSPESLILPSSTIAGLPAAGTTGRLMYVSNAINSNGATGTIATDNGSNWIDWTDNAAVHT